MNINEFIEKKKKELDIFEEDWISSNKVNPDSWPMELPEGEWDDQYLIYLTNDVEGD